MGAPTAAAMRGSTSSGASIAASDTKAVPVREAVVQSLTYCDREPRLADAAWAGEGDQAHLG